MSSTGAGYDLSTTTFSPDGRVFQVEYACKAVDNSGTAVGLKCKDGVILGVEKFVLSKMLVPGTNKRLFHVDKHIGMAMGGLIADGRQLVKRAQSEASNYYSTYGHPVPGKVISDRMAMFAHAYTLYWSVRPFGAAALMGVYDEDGPQLYMVEPSGSCLRYYGCAIGKGKTAAKTEIEKLDLNNLTVREACYHVAKIIHSVHDDTKDKEFELELSWICPESNFEHQMVPKTIRDEAQARAKADLERDEMQD